MVLDNTIVARNLSGADPDNIDVMGTGRLSGSYNLVGPDYQPPAGLADQSVDPAHHNRVGVDDPGLAAAPADNDGLTGTIALLPGSPAIDAGSDDLAVEPSTGSRLATDQRGTGFPRVSGKAVDIGAYEVQGAPTSVTQLVVTAQPPASVAAGAAFGLTVAAEDGAGHLVGSFSGTLSLALASNPGGATLGGGLTATVQNGVAAFSGLTLNKAAQGYTLSIFSDNLTDTATTSAFSVTPAAATQLAVTTQPPALVKAGSGFGLVVSAVDPFGNVDPNFGGRVTVVLAINAGGATLGGTPSATASSGVATFSDLTLDRAAEGYTLSLSSTGLTAAVTGPFDVTPASADHLQVTAQPPGNVVAGAGFGLTVAAEDSTGNVDSSFNGTVVIALASNPGGDNLDGTLSATASNGVATFSGLVLDKAASGYTLALSTPGVTDAVTNPLAVTHAAAVQLVVTVQPPPRITTATGFGLTVAAEDFYGNVDPSFGGSVMLALASNPGGATLGGTLTAMARSGVATFSGLTLDKAASGYAIQVTSNGLAPATTATFAATPPIVAMQLVMTAQPPGTVTAGSGFGLTVSAEDGVGHVDTSFVGIITVALAGHPGGSTLGGTLAATASHGVASFSGLTLNKAGTGYTLQVRGGGLTIATTTTFAVTPAAASQVVVLNHPPGSIMAGSGFGLVVTAQDAYGNVVTSFGGNMSVAVAANPGGAALGGNTTVVAVNGVASFAGLTLDRAGNGYVLALSSPGLSAAMTSSVNVMPPPTIVDAGILTAGKGRNKHFIGFKLDFSAAIDPASAQNSANYSVTQTMVKIVRRKKSNVDRAVRFRVTYDSAAHEVDLIVSGKPAFARGGKIGVTASPPTGLTDASGVSVDAAGSGVSGSDGHFTILKKARGVIR